MDETGTHLTSVVGPFSEGDSFTLRCDVIGGKFHNVEFPTGPLEEVTQTE